MVKCLLHVGLIPYEIAWTYAIAGILVVTKQVSLWLGIKNVHAKFEC